MARGGVNKAIVQIAREALLARGEHPSIDAVRVELGNTGSKSTIHRYLKELEESDTRRKGAVGLTDELTELVARVAQRIEDEAKEHVERALAASDEDKAELEDQLKASQVAFANLQQQFDIQSASLELQTEHLQTARASLQSEQTRNARLSQANDDFELRLKERDEQIRSLEEKHLHARDALEHYRNAVKDQREQEQRRHEGQVQQIQMEVRTLQQTLSIKQDELTNLNRDNERLLTEIRQLNKTSQEMVSHSERQAGAIDSLKIQVAQVEGGKQVLSDQTNKLQNEVARLTESLKAQSMELNNLLQKIEELNPLNEGTKGQGAEGP